jgi:thiamine biosynthesis lipoprotein|tara:strand:+ start:937 stop:2013 length:1077 start_codon:yes stop_codon:yes gene_type:complete
MTLAGKGFMKSHKTNLTGLEKASFLFFTLLIFVLVSGCDHAPEIIKISGSKMGTSYHVTIVADQPAPADLADQIDQLLSAVDQSMSTYKSQSELSQFNRLPVSQQAKASDQLWAVLQTSEKIWRESSGAFDPTVGPVVDLWGFGPVVTEDEIPADQEIATALANSGFEHLLLNRSEQTISKQKTIALDLSAVAKGYAVDQVADLLEMLALPDYLVEVGGEMRLSGTNPEGNPWRVAIELPSLMPQVQQVVAVNNSAVATSGDYRNYFEKDGVRYSHTIDPRNGKPITHNLASVTVMADRCADADAWATALMVLGEEEGMRIANKFSIPAYMLIREGETFRVLSSSAFEPYLKNTEDEI